MTELPKEPKWPEVYLQRPTPVADVENYTVWGPADGTGSVPHPSDGEASRYVPAEAIAKERERWEVELLSERSVELAAEPIYLSLPFDQSSEEVEGHGSLEEGKGLGP